MNLNIRIEIRQSDSGSEQVDRWIQNLYNRKDTGLQKDNRMADYTYEKENR